MTIEEAIKTAIQYEKRVVQVYEEAAGSSQDETGRKIFAALVKEEQQHVAYLESRLTEWKATGRGTAASPGRVVDIERGHQAIVQAEMNAVAGNGYWFDIPEISMES